MNALVTSLSRGKVCAPQSLLQSEDLSPATRATLAAFQENEEAPPTEWSEEDVVYLHWRLLEELRRLQDPETPLAMKLDLLRWVFSDATHSERPFSFERCVRTVSLSSHSPTAFFGDVDVEEIRDWIQGKARTWLGQSLSRYPAWVQELVYSQPAYVADKLDSNSQWLNEQVLLRSHQKQGDLFV
ncbi:MAG TPA: hypothetical protein PK177_00090 [Burkholderiaceae bacterium]|nr:hypothetical protein [Burkholderiaceae bacterium]